GVRPELIDSFVLRGALVERVTLKSGVPLAEVEPLFRRHPVRLLSVSDGSLLGELAASPVLGLVGGLNLDLGTPFPSRALSLALGRLFGSPRRRRLRERGLGGEVADNSLAQVLAACPGLRELRRLRLTAPRLDDSGVVRLLRPGSFPRLEDWHVECHRATGLGLANLFAPARARRWRALTWPSLRSCEASDLAGLARCVSLGRLELALPFPRRARWPRSAEETRFDWLDSLGSLRELRLFGSVDLSALAE